MKLPVHRIIPFSNVEGYGNRTSIFVQGCNANCLYCHNSETIPMTSKDTMQYTVEELVEIIKVQIPYIRGITVSGGEATLYPKFLIELFKEVRKLGLTCYIDTNGFFDYTKLIPLISETDKFLYDIKGIGKSLDKLCFSDDLLEVNNLTKNFSKRFGVNNEHLKSLELLLKLNKVEEVRLVYLKGFYNIDEVIDDIYNVLKSYPDVIFKVIRMHARGLPKERLKLLKGAIPTIKDFEEVKMKIKEIEFHRLEFIE
jgi:pyruvate-formate lyase-activating enzyme